MPVAVRRHRVDRRIIREDRLQAARSAAGCGDLGAAMLDLRPLLKSVAPPHVELEVETMPCPGLTRLTREDLACVLLHRVRCTASEMPAGGRLRVTAQYGNGFNFLDRALFPDAQPENVVITIEECNAKRADRTKGLIPEAVPTEIDERVRAAGAQMRRHLPPGRGIRLELDVPVT